MKSEGKLPDSHAHFLRTAWMFVCPSVRGEGAHNTGPLVAAVKALAQLGIDAPSGNDMRGLDMPSGVRRRLLDLAVVAVVEGSASVLPEC